MKRLFSRFKKKEKTLEEILIDLIDKDINLHPEDWSKHRDRYSSGDDIVNKKLNIEVCYAYSSEYYTIDNTYKVPIVKIKEWIHKLEEPVRIAHEKRKQEKLANMVNGLIDRVQD